MRAKPELKEKTLQFLEDFLYAGSSALILSLVHTHTEYWFISLFALIPFLWRLTRANLCRSVVLGIILAGCYAFVAFIDELLVSPWTFLLELFLLCLVFSIFGVAVNRIKRYVGFNAVIFIAFFWLPLEYALSHYAHLGGIFTFSEIDSALLIRFSSLFGLLVVSFVVVLINSLILIILKRVAQALRSRSAFAAKDDKKPYPSFKETILQRRWYYFPDLRAPPIKVAYLS